MSNRDGTSPHPKLLNDVLRVSPRVGQPAVVVRHPGDGTDRAGGVFSSSSPSPAWSPEMVHRRLRRALTLPHVLRQPCVEHDAEAGEPCFRHARGVCGNRVEEALR